MSTAFSSVVSSERRNSTGSMSCDSRRCSDSGMSLSSSISSLEAILPSELILSILSFSDVATTAKCEQVCYTWYLWSRKYHEAAIWRPKLIRKILSSLEISQLVTSGGQDPSVMESGADILGNDHDVFMSHHDEYLISYVLKRIQPSVGGLETWRDLVFAYQVWSDCLPFSRPHGMVLRSGKSRPAQQYLNPDTPSLVQPLSNVEFQLLSLDDVVIHKSSPVQSTNSNNSSRNTPELEEEEQGSSSSSSIRLQSSSNSTNSSEDRFVKHKDAVSPRRVKAVRLGRGTMSLPLNDIRGQIARLASTKLSTSPLQQLWFDNDGQITRGLDLSQFEAKTWNGAFVITPNRPFQSSIRVIPQIRSPYLILEEQFPEERTVTVRVWDPRLHPSGPWISQKDENYLRRNGLVSQTYSNGEKVSWIRGLWVLHGQQPGAALCGTTLMTKRIVTSPNHHENHHHHRLHQQEALVMWDLLNDPIPSQRFEWSEYTPVLTSPPYLPSPSSSPLRDDFDDDTEHGTDLITRYSSFCKRWERVIDRHTSIQDIALNEWGVAIRLVKRHHVPPPHQQRVQEEQHTQQQGEQTHHHRGGTRSTREETFVQLLNTLNGGLFLDLTPDIPSSFFSGAAVFHLSLTRFHIVIYNSDLMAVFDLFKSRAHWVDIQIRIQQTQASHADSPPPRMPRSASHASIFSRSSSRSFSNPNTPHHLHHTSTQYIRKIPVHNGLCSITKLPYVGKPVRLDISDDDCLLLLAPKCQRGEISIVDLKRGTCRTHLLQDGYAEGAHARNGSLAGRSSVGIWIVYEEDLVDVERRDDMMDSSCHSATAVCPIDRRRLREGRSASALRVIWKSIAV